MGESSNLGEIAKQLPIKEAYDDLLHPAAAAFGQTLSYPFRAVNLLLSPFQKWLIQGEARMEEMSRLVSEELKNVPQEKLTEPDPYVAVPAMQAFSYSMDCDELKKMYAKLLAKSIHIDEKDKVHPSYVEIIKQMSPLDARALEFIVKKKAVALCNIRWQKKSPVIWTDLPTFRDYTYGRTLIQHLVNASEDDASDNDITVSFESLNRLGLIQIADDFSIEQEKYEYFEKCDLVLTYKEYMKFDPASDENEIALLKSVAIMTNFGHAFVKVCLSDNSGNAE